MSINFQQGTGIGRNTEHGPLVSFVTPFHNTRAYLSECIESVLRQTYQNWEYILVDNASDDGSSEIARKYAACNPKRIRVVSTGSLLTQVQNYNFALTLIAPDSKYCKVVQADDWIFQDCVGAMVEVAEAHPSVAFVGAYELEGTRVSLDGLPYPTSEISGREACRLYFLKDDYLFGTPTSLLIRANVIRSRVPFYDEARAPFEDAHVCFDLLKTWNFGFVHQVLTFSRRDNESLLSGMRPFRGLLLFRYGAVLTRGKEYLSEQEYAACLREAEREYFLYLGKAVLRGKSPEFWEFHRKGLAALGYTLNRRFLSKWVARVSLDYLGNPKQTIELLWSKRHSLSSVQEEREWVAK